MEIVFAKTRKQKVKNILPSPFSIPYFSFLTFVLYYSVFLLQFLMLRFYKKKKKIILFTSKPMSARFFIILIFALPAIHLLNISISKMYLILFVWIPKLLIYSKKILSHQEIFFVTYICIIANWLAYKKEKKPTQNTSKRHTNQLWSFRRLRIKINTLRLYG